MSADETRELARLVVAFIGVLILFTLAGVAIVLETGDLASAAGATVMGGLVVLLINGRRELLRGHGDRAAVLLIAGLLVGLLISAAIPPPVPALAAAPIMGVAFALSFLHGRRLTLALFAAFFVSIATAIIIELTPASPDLPNEIAMALRVLSMAAVTGLVGLVLYRHRHRLEQAVRRAEAAGDAMRDSEARYRTVVEDVHEVIFRVDADGRWSLLNRAWEELTGHPVAESLGRHVREFIHPDDRESHADLVRPVAAGTTNAYRHELRIVGQDGSTIWMEAHARSLHDEWRRFTGMSGTLTDITVRRVLEERLLAQAFQDDLTGLANRALFKNRLEHALTRRAQSQRLVGLLYLDVDHFKTVNDSLGHTAGDALLKAIAERLRSLLRPEDTIARLGGDEFAILVEDVRLPDDLLALAERVLAAFAAPFEVVDRQVTVHCSVGVVVESTNRTGDEMIRDADVAMYRAKVGGRGSYALFEPSMQAEVAARMELELDLRDAVERELLTLAYQPIVSLPDGAIVAVEALARWDDPKRGSVPPVVFIPCAEESGLIVTLGRWVLRRACADVAYLRRSRPAASDLRLSVNVSPLQLSDPAFVDDVLGALRDTDLPAHALDLEVTESVVLDCGDVGIERLRVLRAAGVGVALDDFGTGYSSLGNLRTLPITQLKVDLSFTRAVLNDGVEAAIVDAVVRLGAALGVEVVAEGIEGAAVADRLARIGCPRGQGYHFGRPQAVDELAASLEGPDRDAPPLGRAVQARGVVAVDALR